MKSLIKVLILLAVDVQFGITSSLWQPINGISVFFDSNDAIVCQGAFWVLMVLLPDYISSFMKPDVALTFLLLGNSSDDEETRLDKLEIKANAWVERQLVQFRDYFFEILGDGEDAIRRKLAQLSPVRTP